MHFIVFYVPSELCRGHDQGKRQGGTTAKLEILKQSSNCTIPVWIGREMEWCDPEGGVCEECCRGEKSV